MKVRPKIEKKKSIVDFADSITNDEEVMMKELFQMCDSNKDGCLSKEELRKVMMQLNIYQSEAEFAKMVTNILKINVAQVFDFFWL